MCNILSFYIAIASAFKLPDSPSCCTSKLLNYNAPVGVFNCICFMLAKKYISTALTAEVQHLRCHTSYMADQKLFYMNIPYLNIIGPYCNGSQWVYWMTVLLSTFAIVSGFGLTKTFICTALTTAELHLRCHISYIAAHDLQYFSFYIAIANELTAAPPYCSRMSLNENAPVDVTNCIWFHANKTIYLHRCDSRWTAQTLS